MRNKYRKETVKMSTTRNILKNNQHTNDKLFSRGFYLSNQKFAVNEYPFYDKWDYVEIDEYNLAVHPQQSYYINLFNDAYLILIGHAYDPFDAIKDEDKIIKRLNILLCKDKKLFWEKFNNLTGVFTLICLKDNKVYLLGDPTGMQTTFYSMKGEYIYISSHTNLVGDLLELEWEPYVERLVQYKFFRLLGNSLPGDITQFKHVKRLVPNHYVIIEPLKKIRIKRFYTPHMIEATEETLAKEASSILHANLELIAEKWQKPAISLTGGCDSKTTLACANGLYNHFSYFSYISSEAEKVDAEAAHQICNALGLEHKIYNIPKNDNELDNTSEVGDILFWNTGGIRRSNANDVRKRAYFDDINDFDVEVKSWASEIGRAYYSKRFHGRTDFGDVPTPRKCTTLYKFFLHDRKLVKQTDQIFSKYLKRYFRQDKDKPVPWQEQFFWEFRVPSWNGLVITGEHKYSFDITIPYNNRRLLNILLSAPLESRINDTLYAKIREYMNPQIDATGVSVTNLLHTENREKAENIYYILHTRFPL